MYHDYLEHGFQYVREKYKYDKTGENLGMMFKRYVSEYDNKALHKVAMKILSGDEHRYNETTIHMS